MRVTWIVRLALTTLVVVLAGTAAATFWRRYMYSPWTRDGRVRVEVVAIAADVSGLVTRVPVVDNQEVVKGDLLVVIDEARYKAALEQAEANLEALRIEVERLKLDVARRARVSGEAVSREDREHDASEAQAAAARYQAALVKRDLAKLDLERTRIYSPVNGYVTNLNIFVGNYLTRGTASLAVIDKNSFWISGYFEETKLPYFKVGDPVEIRLLGDRQPLAGEVESIARGISDRDNPTGQGLLQDVTPTYNWVRLAQRIPVRIRLTSPPDQPLAAGMSCTVVVRPR